MIDLRKQQLASIRVYIGKALLPILGYRGTLTVKPATAGRNSYVYFLEGSGLQPLVLRGEEDKVGLKRRIRGHEILLRYGFDVPEIVHHDLGNSIYQKFGFYFVVETFMSGTFFNSDANDMEISGARLGETLARMHEFRSWRYGWPGEFRWMGNIASGVRLYLKMRKQLKAYRKRNRRSSEVAAKCLRQNYFSTWFLRPRLTTGGYIPSNLLVDKDRVVIIDLAYVRYAFAARDIAQIHLALFENDPKKISAFSKAYRQHASKTLLREIDKTLPFFKTSFLLQMALKENDENRYMELDKELLRYCKMIS